MGGWGHPIWVRFWARPPNLGVILPRAYPIWVRFAACLPNLGQIFRGATQPAEISETPRRRLGMLTKILPRLGRRAATQSGGDLGGATQSGTRFVAEPPSLGEHSGGATRCAKYFVSGIPNLGKTLIKIGRKEEGRGGFSSRFLGHS